MNNCFKPIPADELAPQLPPIEFDKEIKKYKLVPVAVPLKEGSEECSIAYKVVEDVTLDIQEFIDSQSDDVGIQNILKKVAMTGDTSLYNQTGRKGLPVDETGKEVINDLTNFPTSINEAVELAKAANSEFAKIDKELTQNKSIGQFLDGLDPATIEAYLASKKGE